MSSGQHAHFRLEDTVREGKAISLWGGSKVVCFWVRGNEQVTKKLEAFGQRQIGTMPRKIKKIDGR